VKRSLLFQLYLFIYQFLDDADQWNKVCHIYDDDDDGVDDGDDDDNNSYEIFKLIDVGTNIFPSLFC
jgi:hypothetical protein